MNYQRVTWKSGPTDAPLPPLIQPLQLPKDIDYPHGPVSTFLLDSYLKIGPIFRFCRANQEFTVIAGPEANLFMSHEGKNHFRAREFRQEQNDEFGVEKTLVSMSGKEHSRFRRLQRRGYSRSAFDGRYAELVGITRDIVGQWQPGQRVLVKEVMLRIIGEQLGVGVLNYPLGDYLDDILLFVRAVVIEIVAKMRPKSVLYTPFYRWAKERSMELADKVIEMHRTQSMHHRKSDLVDDLLKALAKDKELFSEQELRIAVLGGYIGGLDTVAYTCSFMLYALLKHPDVLARVTVEVDELFADGLPTPTTLRGIKALHHTALETLRMYPVAEAIQGTVARPFEFAGYRVAEGQHLIVGTTVPHYLPEFYPNPYHFDIDRYNEPRSEHQQAGAFAPFGVGEHICLGVGMAEVLIMLTMATLLHTVHLEMDPPDYQLKMQAMPTPVPKDFYVCVVQQRL